MQDNGDFKIINATLNDIDEIRRLTKILCLELGKNFNEERFMHGLKNRLTDKVQKNGYYIVKKGDKAAGMIFAEISEVDNKLEGFIKTLVIDPAYRGFKIGEEMLQKAISYFKEKNIKTIRTNIHKKAQAAISLYNKFGFINELALEPFKRFILTL